MTRTLSLTDWAYKWFSITWEEGSGNRFGSEFSSISLFRSDFNSWGGRKGGPCMVGVPLRPLLLLLELELELLLFFVSHLGLIWPQSFWACGPSEKNFILFLKNIDLNLKHKVDLILKHLTFMEDSQMMSLKSDPNFNSSLSLLCKNGYFIYPLKWHHSSAINLLIATYLYLFSWSWAGV